MPEPAPTLRLVPKEPTPADLARGERIRTAREAKNLGQAEMGRRAGGVASTTALRWEKGHSPPTGDRLERLAQVLDVTPEWIMTGENREGRRPIPPALSELFERRPDLKAAADENLIDDLLSMVARNAVGAKTWLDWQRIVEPITTLRSSPSHQEKRRKRRPT